jgi:short-subunit dehydrogenase
MKRDAFRGEEVIVTGASAGIGRAGGQGALAAQAKL